MNSWLSDTMPLMTAILKYLVPKDIARWRQVAKEPKNQTNLYVRNWPNFISKHYSTRLCFFCKSIRSSFQTEWCALCEHWVCIDHLCKCHNCGQIFCRQCIFHCCR